MHEASLDLFFFVFFLCSFKGSFSQEEIIKCLNCKITVVHLFRAGPHWEKQELRQKILGKQLLKNRTGFGLKGDVENSQV